MTIVKLPEARLSYSIEGLAARCELGPSSHHSEAQCETLFHFDVTRREAGATHHFIPFLVFILGLVLWFTWL